MVKDYWLWIAYEPAINTYVYNDMHLSRERTIFICYQFFKQLRDRYMAERNPYSQMVGARWYDDDDDDDDACKWLRLQHQVYTVLN